MRALPQPIAVLRLIDHTTRAGRTLALSCAAFSCFHAAAAPSADDADAPPTPLLHRALPGTAAGVEPGHADWREAHRAVSEFPRGHADIVAWERLQAGAQTKPHDRSHHQNHHGHGAAAPKATP